MKRKIWYAVSKYGQGRVFTTLPVRNQHWGLWEGESVGCISTLFMIFEADGLELPNMTFKDEPVELELSIGVP